MRAWRFRWGAAVAVAGMLVGARCAAQVEEAPVAVPAPSVPPAAPPAGPTAHGLFAGAGLGLGELHFSYGPYVFWGRSSSIALWAGGALTRNLILFGQLYETHVFGPSSTYGELSDLNLINDRPRHKNNQTPTNVFLSGSVMLSKVRFGID